MRRNVNRLMKMPIKKTTVKKTVTKKRTISRSTLEHKFQANWNKTYPATKLVREYKFSDRGYRFDFAHPKSKVAIEIQGGTHLPYGAHSSAVGLQRDYEKLAIASSLGWRVFMLSGSMIEPRYLKMIKSAIEMRSL